MARVTSVIREDAHKIAEGMQSALQSLLGTTILITGAGGFLGSYYLDVIAALNRQSAAGACRVLAVDNFKTGLPERIAHLEGDPHFRFIEHDVIQPFDPEEPIDWIMHCAGIASPPFYRRFPLETIDVNVTGTRHMLDLARRYSAQGMLLLSSSEIYGDPAPSAIPTAEDYRGYVSCTGPRACYDESKRLGETLATVYHRSFNTAVKIVRPFNVYGPGQRLDDQRIIPDLMSAAVRQQPLVLYSDGRATRAFCYIRDFIRGALYVLLCGAPGEAYNVGNDEEVSMSAAAQMMAELAGPPRLPVEYRVSQDAHYLTDNPQRRCPDLRKLMALIPYRPEVSLAEGLSRTLTSYRETLLP